MRKTLLLLVLTTIPALASEPGQPLDCSDWVFLEPGLYCSEYLADCVRAEDEIGDTTSIHDPLCFNSQGTALDVEGNLYRIRWRNIGSCNGDPTRMNRVELLRARNGQQEVIAYVDSRCNPDGSVDAASVTDNLQMRIHPFDGTNGRIMFSLSSESYGSDPSYPGKYWVVAINGFTTTFEVLQSYYPSKTTSGFRVPYMPEGFQSADSFDTYYGSLSTVGDWSQAQSLQCDYPSSIPEAGDYLTVPDSLPMPGPGQGYYYVTAVHYAGETRYGRQCVNGVLSGRDPGVLPGCAK